MIVEIHTAAHSLYLDDLSHYGVVLMPKPDHDMTSPLHCSQSLHGADWDHMIRLADRVSWEPLDDDERGGMVVDAVTSTGRELWSMYCREPIHDHLDPEAYLAARADVLDMIERNAA